jgi:hypothetical protein
MKFLDKLLGRSTPSVTPVVPTPVVAPVVTPTVTTVSKGDRAAVRGELIAAVNAARTKAEASRNETAQARLDVAKMRVELLRLKSELESLRATVTRLSGPDTDRLASIGQLLDDNPTVTSSRNGNAIDLKTHEFGNRVRL